jgi:hypothetical protein
MATTNKYITNILPTVAPRLPAAPPQYDPRFIEQYSNILRLYFNGIDTTFGGLLGQPQAKTPLHPGGAYLNFPYAACQRTTDKTFTANTATLVTMNQNDFLNDCANSGTDGIVVNNAGIYNYQFSVQFANTDTQIQTAYIWLQINGVDVPGTGSKWDCPAKHGSSDGYLIAAANFYVQLNAGDHVDMYAAVTSSTLYMEAYAAQVSPWAMPSIPSVVATLSFVSSIPS